MSLCFSVPLDAQCRLSLYVHYMFTYNCSNTTSSVSNQCAKYYEIAQLLISYAAFSILIISRIPSCISRTAWYSVRPIRRLFEMS